MIRIGRYIVLIALLTSWSGLAMGEDVDVKALQENLRAQEKRLKELQEKLDGGSGKFNIAHRKKSSRSPLDILFFRIVPNEYARSIGQSPSWKYNPFSLGEMKKFLAPAGSMPEKLPDDHPAIGNRGIVPMPKVSTDPPETAHGSNPKNQAGTDGEALASRDDSANSDTAKQLASIYRFEQRREYVEAIQRYMAFILSFPKANEAGVALQRLAKCLYELENYYTSFLAIEQVIQGYPKSARMSDLVEIELRIAQRLMHADRPGQLLGIRKNADALDIKRAVGILDTAIAHDPYGPLAPEAYIAMGEGYLYLNQAPAARTIFEIIRDEFPRSDFAERVRLGMLYCDRSMGQANPRDVREQMTFPFLQERSPPEQDKASQDDLDSSLAQLAEVEAGKMMEQAERYKAMGTESGLNAVKFLYKKIIRGYPGTPQAERARSILIELGVSVPDQADRVEPPWIAPPLTPERTDADKDADSPPLNPAPNPSGDGGVTSIPPNNRQKDDDYFDPALFELGLKETARMKFQAYLYKEMFGRHSNGSRDLLYRVPDDVALLPRGDSAGKPAMVQLPGVSSEAEQEYVQLESDSESAMEWKWAEGKPWAQGAGEPKPTEQEQFALAYRLDTSGKHMEAAQQYFLLLRSFPDANDVGMSLQRLAKCLYEMEDYRTSFQAVEQALRSYPDACHKGQLAEIELWIAEMLFAKWYSPASNTRPGERPADIELVLRILDRVLALDPHISIVAEAHLLRGLAWLESCDYLKARAAFATIRDTIPQSNFVAHARLGIDYCDQLMGWKISAKPWYPKLFKPRDRQSLEFGNWGHESGHAVAEREESEAGKKMEQAEVYRKMGTRNSTESARFLYREIIRRYPHTSQSAEARKILDTLIVSEPPTVGPMAGMFRYQIIIRYYTDSIMIADSPFVWEKEGEPQWPVPPSWTVSDRQFGGGKHHVSTTAESLFDRRENSCRRRHVVIRLPAGR